MARSNKKKNPGAAAAPAVQAGGAKGAKGKGAAAAKAAASPAAAKGKGGKPQAAAGAGGGLSKDTLSKLEKVLSEVDGMAARIKKLEKKKSDSASQADDDDASVSSDSDDSSDSSRSDSKLSPEEKEKKRLRNLAKFAARPTRKAVQDMETASLLTLSPEDVVQVESRWSDWVNAPTDEEERQTRANILCSRISSEFLDPTAGPKKMGSAFFEAPVMAAIVSIALRAGTDKEKLSKIMSLVGTRCVFIKVAGREGISRASDWWRHKTESSLLDKSARKALKRKKAKKSKR